ncbi:hypothetical protein COV19_01910 [Candidatus Woesearchaeota archaeon CG10_big_fil_rev_8_21_14_0_10_44_13]|nr:MAG: hypothetical protein COV19_01910 [Candidatus Woesearchaeota archaeon CG10_big_fil_rev_8_21_14_0_10_44_13]
MSEEFFEIEPGIFSIAGHLPCGKSFIQEPAPSEGVVLLVQPFVGIPLDREGMQRYVGRLYELGDPAKEARMYEIAIKSLLAFCEWPVVILEEADRVKDWAQIPFINLRAEYGMEESYIISVGEKELMSGSDFPQKLSNFLARFHADKIDVAGRCDKIVMEYLSVLPPVTIDGAERRLKFIKSKDKSIIMTPERNPLGYQTNAILSLEEKTTIS